MTFDTRGPSAPDYLPCRYGTSRLTFRGPRKKLTDDYVAVLGGTETYGKFIETPFPELAETHLGMPVVNFGCQNAGVDAFAHDSVILEAANDARAVVIQAMGAHNMSNRLYTVHPRRNDRFLNASSLLKAVYREVDFTEFHFTRHLLSTLKSIDKQRFEMVREELKQAWLARMKLLISNINRPVMLMWFADHYPPKLGEPDEADPMYIDVNMLDEIEPITAGLIEVVASSAAKQEGVLRMRFDPMDRAAAEEQLSVMAHEEAAERLTQSLAALLHAKH